MDYSKISKNREEDLAAEIENEEACAECQINYPEDLEASTEPGTADVVFGIVSCGMLNVRKEPNVAAKAIAVVKRGTTLEIDQEKSNDEWLCVCTASGVEGYCMAQYVEIND